MIETEIKFKTLTPIWTGDADQKCTTIKETSIIGSMRWWYEALVRGMGGYACDPSNGGCEFNTKDYEKALEKGQNVDEALEIGLKNVCPACTLFGCTGWKRRFKIVANDLEGTFNQRMNDDGYSGIFEIKFYEIFKISDSEKWLLYQTLQIIENYGALGGRTTRKPQGSPVGKDYGLIKVNLVNTGWASKSDYSKTQKWIKTITENCGKINNKNWFDFRYYWLIKGEYLDRLKINEIFGLDNKGNISVSGDEFLEFLRGNRASSMTPSSSKKIFSFKIGNKVFGYVRNEQELDIIKRRLQTRVKQDINQIITGKDILLNIQNGRNVDV
ncbi:MAG: type III-B CRISPR module RAMP protein Cmr1 [Methanobacterium sp.]